MGTTMSEEAALLRAIYANPDDDTPRLVYADWLDEHGQPERAEFIRVQVELARTECEESHQRLEERADELHEAHCEEWTKGLGKFNEERITIEFDRGFPERLEFTDARPKDFTILQKLPGVRRISVSDGKLNAAVLRAIAGMKQLDELRIFDTPFQREWLRLVESLPCWTVIRIRPRGDEFSERVWRGFKERRTAKISKLNTDDRRKAALRFLRFYERDQLGFVQPTAKQALLDQSAVSDAEMQLLAAVPELEEVYISESDVTTAGIMSLAKCPNLKSIVLHSVPVDSISPLGACTNLEGLGFAPEVGVVINDEAVTEGLERLTNLKELALEEGGHSGFGAATIRRIGELRNLRVLYLDPARALDKSSFAPLSHLTQLEHLSVRGAQSDGVFQYLASLRRLKHLSLYVSEGTGDGFRHLTGLTELAVMHVAGAAVNDVSARHLTPLKNLRMWNAQGSPITECAARELANQLPNVTIVLDEHVVKSPRATIGFRRRAIPGIASACFPIHWTDDTRNASPDESIWVQEDGWEHAGGWSGDVVGPGSIYLYLSDSGVKTSLRDCVRNNSSLNPRVIERDVVKLTGKDTASCVFRNDRHQHLACASADGGKCVVLDCHTPAARFDEFRPLFEDIARSLRVGKAAMKGVGEEKTVAVSRL
jgi:uncharacterized protein (TIGR02996 family)